MALKKNLRYESNEIDISQLSKQWLSHKKLVFFATIIVALISIFILIIFDKTLSNQKQEYVMTILQGDLGKSNTRIYSALRSREYLNETLIIVGLDLDPAKINKNLVIKFNTNPLKESLQSRIISLEDKDIKNLALSNEELSSITQSLNDNSQDIISITLYHIPLNISFEQANNFLTALIQNVNNKILLRTNREKLNLKMINTKNLDVYFNEYEQLSRLTNMINSIQSNLNVMRKNYEELLLGIDLSEYNNLADMSQKLLHELSKNLGNTNAIDSLNINILNKDRDIEDLKYSLEILNPEQLLSNISGNKQNNDETTNNTQLDGEVFEKILVIGSEISLTNFKLDTLSKIQSLQQEKNLLIKQIDLLNLPISIQRKSFTNESVEKKIRNLTNDVNEAVMQIRNFTQPKVAVRILKNPELVLLNSKNINELIKIVGILTLVGLFIISFISFLIPYKK